MPTETHLVAFADLVDDAAGGGQLRQLDFPARVRCAPRCPSISGHLARLSPRFHRGGDAGGVSVSYTLLCQRCTKGPPEP
jgi:hypothetical protein